MRSLLPTQALRLLRRFCKSYFRLVSSLWISLGSFRARYLGLRRKPDWLTDWSAFLCLLRSHFGPIDPVTDAEDAIDNLKMRENQRIFKYAVEFNRFAIKTGWDDAVLCHRYYSGLA